MKKQMSIKNLAGIAIACGMLFLASCVKNRNEGAVDFSQLTPIMQIPEGGLKNFSNTALVFDATNASDTASFRVNYAATTVAPSDIAVTLAVDDAARIAYNASHTDQYEKAPDSIYKFTTISTVVKAGQSYSDLVKFTVYPNKVDQSKSYMIAITITNASGVNISSNFGTIYYHLIGNPLAGDYNVLFTRWNYTGAVAWAGPSASLPLAVAPLDANHIAQPTSNPPAGGTVSFWGETGVPNPSYPLGHPATTFAPVTDHIVTGYIGNVPEPGASTGASYFITADATFATISYDFAPLWYSNPAAGGAGYSNTAKYVRGYVPPTPTQKPAFRLITQYNNALAGAGNDRIVDETFRHK